MPAETDVIAATGTPVTKRTLLADLASLGVAAGDIVMVHSSLSALGWVAGGPQTVVEALREAVGVGGTIVMPTQSGNLSDPANWSNPPVPAAWVSTLREELPVFDPDLTPTRGMGEIVECFRHHRSTRRSAHPLVSVAANGPAAAEIVGDHRLSPSLGEGSPLATLYELDAQVLLLGVGHGSNTSMHLAEYRADWEGKTAHQQGVPALVDGARTWVTYEDLSLEDDDFERIGQEFAATGGEVQGLVGAATARMSRQRAIVDFAVDCISRNR